MPNISLPPYPALKNPSIRMASILIILMILLISAPPAIADELFGMGGMMRSRTLDTVLDPACDSVGRALAVLLSAISVERGIRTATGVELRRYRIFARDKGK